MPSPDRVFSLLMDFLKAPTWGYSRQIVSTNQGLINVWIEMIDTVLTDPTTVMMIYPDRTRSDATALLKKHRSVLARCQQAGIGQAFAEVDGQTTRRDSSNVRVSGGSGGAWFMVFIALAVLAGIILLVIKLSGGSGTPSNVTASALSKYKIKVSWTNNLKSVTGFHIDNGCPLGTCGGHGITLAKTTGPGTSAIFLVTPGTYQCFRVQAFSRTTTTGWSDYGCTSTPSLNIYPTHGWISTHVILSSGDRLFIKASGQLTTGSSPSVYPAGEPSCTPRVNHPSSASNYLSPQLPCLSLIARIGHHRAFEVGNSVSLITPHGRLYLGVNGSHFSGSSGSWTVNIKIGGSPPSP